MPSNNQTYSSSDVEQLNENYVRQAVQIAIENADQQDDFLERMHDHDDAYVHELYTAMGHSENPHAVFRANEFDASYGLSVTPSRAPEPSMPPEVTMDGASRAIAQARAARAAATNQIDQRVKTMKARFTSPVRGEGQPATATSPHQQWNNPTTAQSPWKGSFQPESNNNSNNPFGLRDPSPAAYSMRSVGASPNQGRLRSAERSPTKSKYKARRQYTPGNPAGTAISKSSTGTSSTSRQVLPQAAPPTSTDTSFNIASIHNPAFGSSSSGAYGSHVHPTTGVPAHTSTSAARSLTPNFARIGFPSTGQPWPQPPEHFSAAAPVKSFETTGSSNAATRPMF